jgi:hypothetical protein
MGGRLSSGPAVSAAFDFAVQGVRVSALSFDMDEEAYGFVRDLTVRLRLTRASLKAARGLTSLSELKEQLFDLRRNGLLPTLMRWAIWLSMAVLCVTLLHGIVLYFNDDRPLLDITGEVLHNTVMIAENLGGLARNFGVAACEVVQGGRSVSSAALHECAAMTYAQDAKACLVDLSTRVHLR